MRLDLFLEQAPLNILILNDEYRVVQMSRGLAQLTHISHPSSSGKLLCELLPRLESVIRPSLDRAREGERAVFETDAQPTVYPGVAGRWSVLCFPLPESEIGVVISEVTEQRKMEEKLRQTERQLDAAMAEIGRNSLVNEMTYSLQASNTIEEIYQNVGRFGARLFPKNSGALCIIDSSKNLIETTASWGDTSRVESVFAADTCRALCSARPHLVQNPSIETMCAHVIGKKGAHLCMPMVAQSETLGILHLFDPIFHDAGDAFTPTQLRLAEKVTEQIALPLANLRLRDVLQQQALRDPLTGLYNRRFFSEALHRELRRAVRKHSSVGLIMLDLDHFKRFNDTHGHPAGDALLNSVSALLQSGVRAGDVLCRLGGDEFSVLMPEATLEDTIARAHELRNAVKALDFKWHEQSLPGISISCGAAAFPTHGTTAEGLLERADAGLYLAKESGRDQVMTSIASSSSAAG